MIIKRVLLLVLLLIIVGCDSPTAVAPSAPTTLAPPAEPTAVAEVAPDTPATAVVASAAQDQEAVASKLLISEVLIGAPGANNLEFIELYNASDTAVDLHGWSLWYQNRADAEEMRVAAWKSRADVPPAGHYLLVRQEQDLGLLPDTVFTVPLSERKGGLILRDETGTAIDIFGWGEAPAGYVAGTAVAAITDGASMERLPGGEAGNGVQSKNNSADFIANIVPNPQNSGSTPTPLPAANLTVALTVPDVVQPGVTFDYQVAVGNQTGGLAEMITVTVPVAEHFEIVSLPDGANQADGFVNWTIEQLAYGAVADFTITLRAPFTYVDTLINGFYAETAVAPRAYGPPQLVTMAGGAVPIATARGLEGQTVSVEGLATMYTGGFFAGSTSTKFYLEDETGGVQVFIPGGAQDVVVAIGDKLRVTGVITPYRDSLELIADDAADVELIRAQAAKPIPIAISIADNENKDTVLGRLNTLAGTATRVDEFNYSFEVDLTDEEGNTTLVYIDKDTGVTAEPLIVGEQYRVAGISEFYSGRKEILPRLQSDIKQIFPPELRVAIKAANSINAGNLLSYEITATNYTNDPLSAVRVTAVPPSGAEVMAISTGGVAENGQIVWMIDELADRGGNVTLSYTVQSNAETGDQIEAGAVTAVAQQWPDAVEMPGYLTFVGSGVPIWAIQGADSRSPYVGNVAAAEGIVTGVFPELQGFWLQEVVADDNPATSEGVFVLFGDEELPELPLNEGDLVQVQGKVREISGQTTLHVADATAITLISSNNELPPAVLFDPPAANEAALVYKESLEGMLVAGPATAVAIAPTTKYGETVLLNSELGIDSVRRGSETGHFIVIDDGSAMTHLEQETMPLALQKGDSISQIVGPLAYTFDQFKIELISEPVVVAEQRPLPTVEPLTEDQFSIATFNAENFFDRFDPHPSDPSKPGKTAYQLKLNKLAEAILAMGTPTIIGLQEVENINVLQDLTETTQLAPYNYEPYLIEGFDARGIDVGYLVRADQAVVVRVESFPEPTGLTSRPPLLLTANISLEDGREQTIYILNNHFSSLASGEAATEPRRTGQAAWNAQIMDTIRAQDAQAQFIILGDLNSFRNTLPLDTLQAAGLRHIYDFFPDESAIPYTYIFQGATQSLDHILVSEGLFDQLAGVTTLPINADYPPAAAADDSAKRVSDHDPLIAVFTSSR